MNFTNRSKSRSLAVDQQIRLLQKSIDFKTLLDCANAPSYSAPFSHNEDPLELSPEERHLLLQQFTGPNDPMDEMTPSSNQSSNDLFKSPHSEETRKRLLNLVANADNSAGTSAQPDGFLNPFLAHCLTMPESPYRSDIDHALETTDLVLSASSEDIEKCILCIEKAKKMNTRINRKRKRGPEPSNSALYYYRMDVLEEVAEKYPNASPADIVEVVQSQWDKLDKKAKEQYFRLSQLDKKRFDEEAKQYIPRSEGGTMKRPKRKKHPNAPKHPMSGFLYFAADQRAKVKDDNPGKNFTEIAKILGERWRKIDPETKKRYDERSDVDKARYRKEKMSFEPCPLVMETKKRKKHPLAPKHPLSGYLFFVANNRGEFNKRYPDKNFTEVANLLGQHWKTLTEKEKRKYNILAAADKKRYEEEKQKWQPPIERG